METNTYQAPIIGTVLNSLQELSPLVITQLYEVGIIIIVALQMRKPNLCRIKQFTQGWRARKLVQIQNQV